jgi:hypothetical protein
MATIWISIGETIRELGPGLLIWISAREKPGAGVGVLVGMGVGGTIVAVSVAVSVGVTPAERVALMELAVRYITVGMYPGGYGVGSMLLAPGNVQPVNKIERKINSRNFVDMSSKINALVGGRLSFLFSSDL